MKLPVDSIWTCLQSCDAAVNNTRVDEGLIPLYVDYYVELLLQLGRSLMTPFCACSMSKKLWLQWNDFLPCRL